MKRAIESYAKLEVRVKDEMFGIENYDNDEIDDDFWNFVFKFRDKLQEDTKLLNNHVSVEKIKLIIKKNNDDDEDIPMDINEIIKNALDLMKDFDKHGEECFKTCSNAQIHSVGGLIGYFNHPDI